MKKAIYNGEEVYLMAILPPPCDSSNPIAVIQHKNGKIDHWSTTQIRMIDVIDWEERRYQICKEILSGLISIEGGSRPEPDCKFVISYADEMIKQLKGELP